MIIKRKIFVFFLILILVKNFFCGNLFSQKAEEWGKDIDILTKNIERYHPKPWGKVSRETFMRKAHEIKANFKGWNREKIVIQIMKLVASLRDGHTEVTLNNQENFNLWFPIRFEKLYNGIFITAIEKKYSELLGAKVVVMGNNRVNTVYKKVGEIIASDSDHGLARVITNYLSNSIILKALEIIKNKKLLPLSVIFPDGTKRHISVESHTWNMALNWAWNKNAVPTYKEVRTIYDGKMKKLPLYLSRIIPSRIPYWYKYLPKDQMIYFQFNDVTNWGKEPFKDFIESLFSTYDEYISQIEKFVIDLRFNEGGNGELLKPLVREFVIRGKSLDRGKLFIITGGNTFSAASNLIGKMLKNTNVITVGDIASGPLNWCSDIIKFILPRSKIMVNISSMAWQEGHPTDNRGYYPPDNYIPFTSKSYISFSDPALEVIKAKKVVSLKDILFNQGTEKFIAELNKREKEYGSMKNWFPYTSFDLLLYTFQTLAPAGKIDEAWQLSKLNTTLYPEDLRAWYILAMINKAKGKLNEALKCYDKILSMEPYYVEPRWERDKIKALIEPYKLKKSTIQEYLGHYRDRQILLENGILFYKWNNKQRKKLVPISDTHFLIDGSNTRIEFMTDIGVPMAIRLYRYNGKSKTYYKTKTK